MRIESRKSKKKCLELEGDMDSIHKEQVLNEPVHFDNLPY